MRKTVLKRTFAAVAVVVVIALALVSWGRYAAMDGGGAHQHEAGEQHHG